MNSGKTYVFGFIAFAGIFTVIAVLKFMGKISLFG